MLALAIVFCLPPVVQADWPHLRGPSYDGLSTDIGLADAWPADGPPRLWSRALGQGYSGFIVADGKLYTQRQTLAGQQLLCLHPDTGETIWEHRCDWAWQPKGAYPGPYSSPTYYRGKVFYASTTGIVGCVDANTGAALWSLNVIEKFKGKGCGFGYAGTPLVEDDRVILPVGGPGASLVALHVDEGRTLWTAGSDPASYCPALPITFQGRRLVVGYLQNALVLVDPATGKLVHRQPLSAGYDEHSAWPIYREPHLLVASPFRVPAQRFELQAGVNESLHAMSAWVSKEMCNDVASSVLYGDHLYGFDLKQMQASRHRASRGRFKCVEWTTGKARWSTDLVGQASVIAADGKLIMLSDTGSLILARADPAAYRELARTQLFADEICWTPPTIWQGRLFVRSPSQAICVYIGRAVDLPKELATQASIPPIRSNGFDGSWLLSRERDFPNDAPGWDEMSLWFGVSVLVFGAALIVTVFVVRSAKRRLGRSWPGTTIFLGLAFVLGLFGANAASSAFDQCLFTWPASLYAAFHATLLICWEAQENPAGATKRWLARLAVVGFLLVNWGFYEMCKSVGMFIGWSFLVGYPFAFPVTFLVVRADLRARPLWIVAVWTLLAFAVFFWSAQGLLLWKSGQAT